MVRDAMAVMMGKRIPKDEVVRATTRSAMRLLSGSIEIRTRTGIKVSWDYASLHPSLRPYSCSGRESGSAFFVNEEKTMHL